MSTAQERGWGDPDAKGFRAQHIISITLRCGVKLNVHRAVAHLFKGFFDELEALTGYSLADQGQPDDWGYNNRDIRGRPGVKSNHSWGLAVDGNAEENPMGYAGTNNYPWQTAMLAAKWGLRWGLSYTGRKDAMHFEFEGTPADVARFPIAGATPKPVPTPTHPQEDDMPSNMHYYRIRDEEAAVKGIAKPHPTKGNGIWQTDERVTNVMSEPAYVHMTNLGWRPEEVELIPESLHDWFVQNAHDLNEG